MLCSDFGINKHRKSLMGYQIQLLSENVTMGKNRVKEFCYYKQVFKTIEVVDYVSNDLS